MGVSIVYKYSQRDTDFQILCSSRSPVCVSLDPGRRLFLIPHEVKDFQFPWLGKKRDVEVDCVDISHPKNRERLPCFPHFRELALLSYLIKITPSSWSTQ